MKKLWIISCLLLAGCSGADSATDNVFDADADQDGFITKNEAEAAFKILERNEIAPGLWSINVKSGKDGGTHNEQELCV